MGLAVSSVVPLLPDLYGSPAEGGAYSGAQDYPGLNAGYAGALPVLLLVTGALAGVGGGFVRFCAVGSLLLWGAAFHLPAVEGAVRLVPGFGEVEPTRLLGPVGFLTACGGALVRGLGIFLPVALPEELFFRGLIFRATVAAAQVVDDRRPRIAACAQRGPGKDFLGV